MSSEAVHSEKCLHSYHTFQVLLLIIHHGYSTSQLIFSIPLSSNLLLLDLKSLPHHKLLQDNAEHFSKFSWLRSCCASDLLKAKLWKNGPNQVFI